MHKPGAREPAPVSRTQCHSPVCKAELPHAGGPHVRGPTRPCMMMCIPCRTARARALAAAKPSSGPVLSMARGRRPTALRAGTTLVCSAAAGEVPCRAGRRAHSMAGGRGGLSPARKLVVLHRIGDGRGAICRIRADNNSTSDAAQRQVERPPPAATTAAARSQPLAPADRRN